MGKTLDLLTHPSELRATFELLFLRKPIYARDPAKESPTLRRCYEMLDFTSRSFAAVIKELHPELRDTIALFYLILRALDTVEDDMTLSNKVKIPILRSFYEKLDSDDWSFHDSQEKDKVVLEEFPTILTEYHKLKPEYKEVLKDITKKMGNGMADYATDENFNLVGVQTKKDYDLYCYYVAGLVGEGLTRLSVLAGFADDSLMEKSQLYISMGLFLQKTNIIRDYHEDLVDKRSFWPKEIWGKYANSSLKDFLDENIEFHSKRIYCSSEMVLNALEHVPDVLEYLSLIYEQSIYSFCAIPQVMAVATLELVFQNEDIFSRNVKIRKGQTCQLILKARSFKGTCEVFKEYVRKIHHKSSVEDPNYLKIGIICGKIEQCLEEYFPSGSSEEQLALDERIKQTNQQIDSVSASEDTLFVLIALASVLGIGGLMIAVAHFLGADYGPVSRSIQSLFRIVHDEL